MATSKRVCILGIDRYSKKTSYQTAFFVVKGYQFDIFVTDARNSNASGELGVRVHPLASSFFARLYQVWIFFWRYRAEIHHCELYVGGRFAPFYALIAKIFGQTVLVVERGDIREFFEKNYSFSLRFAMYFAYKLADVVWYKEMFMEPLLRRLGKNRYFLLPNSVPVAKRQENLRRDIDFLWVNRLIAHRHPDWFAHNLFALREDLPQLSFAIVGFMGADGNEDQQAQEAKLRKLFPPADHDRLALYCSPQSYYSRARFFVFPSDYVFCNNALLEAMSYGVIPIVSRREGTDLIVSDGVDGIIIEHSAEGLLQGMRRALTLTEVERERLSQAAIKKVRDNYSVDTWGAKLLERYESIGG